MARQKWSLWHLAVISKYREWFHKKKNFRNKIYVDSTFMSNQNFDVTTKFWNTNADARSASGSEPSCYNKKSCCFSMGNDQHKEEALMMLINPSDAFRGQTRSPNSIIPYVRYTFLLCNSNFVLKTCRFSDIRLQKMSWPWNPGQRSLKVIECGTVR